MCCFHHQYAHCMCYVHQLLASIEGTMSEMVNVAMREQSSVENVDTLRKQLELAKWEYNRELQELQHNFRKT